jgi:hypothetical protein
MIISHSKRFVFVHIHKAGGTSIEQALDPYLAWNDLILGGSPFGERIQQHYSKRFGLNKHSSIAEIEAVCGSQILRDYFVFALVRHPLTRACSVYNFVATTVSNWASRHEIPFAEIRQRITPKAAKKTPGLAWLSTRIFLSTDGFSEFIRHEQIRKAPGFRSQADVLARSAGQRSVGTVFRLEDRQHWEPELALKLDVELRLPHANQSGIRLVDPSTVAASDRALIEDMFGADYREFGYNS